MAIFAISPPVHLNDGHAIATSSEAAAIVRRHAMAHCSLSAATLLRRLEHIEHQQPEDAAEAQRLALEFRAWAAREGLLLKSPQRHRTSH